MLSVNDYPFPYGSGAEGKAKLQRNLADLCWTFRLTRIDAVGRCEHGKPNASRCHECDMGFIHTIHTHFNPRVEPGAVLESDDGETVSYIPATFMQGGHLYEVFWDPDHEEFYVAGSTGHRAWLAERGLLAERVFPDHRRYQTPTPPQPRAKATR